MLEAAKKKLKLTIIDVDVTEDNFLQFLREKNVVFKTYEDEFRDDMKEFFHVNNQAEELLERLKQCKAGKQMWREYQDIITEAFSYLFTPPLNCPKVQSRTIDGLEIRDLVFPNHATQGFWEEMRTEYKGSYIVVEAKNKSKPNQKDVLQVADYLNEKHVGLFGILFSRKLSKSASAKRRKYYSIDRKMIVLFDDADIVRMIQKKSNNEKPEDVIGERIDSYRIQFEF